MEPVVPEDDGVVVDVVEGELDGGHHPPANCRLRDPPRVGEEAGDVEVVPLFEAGWALAGDRAQRTYRQPPPPASHPVPPQSRKEIKDINNV